MTDSPTKRHCATLTLLAATAVAGGCVHSEYININATPAVAATEDMAEDMLLDVVVTIFEPNVPEEAKERAEFHIVQGVRNAEARYMPSVLRRTLQDTGHWGAVRVLPKPSSSADLTVSGKILTSDGERLELAITAVDSTGRVWLDEVEYFDLAGKLNYRREVNGDQDPFQDIYNNIANDMHELRATLTDAEVRRIREVSQLRFAADLAPDAFGDYLRIDDGNVQVVRLPSGQDPMLARVEKIRERDYLFIDTLDGHFGGFQRNMTPAYDEWRRFNYEEIVELRRLQREIRNRTIAGAAAIVGGIAVNASTDTQYGKFAGQSAALVGLATILSTLPMRPELQVHAETLRELGDSFDAEVRPLVLEVEGKTITLSGSAEAQYDKWRHLLRDIYTTETGLPVITQPGEASASDSPGS